MDVTRVRRVSPHAVTLPTLSSAPSRNERLIAYYEGSGPDFAEWSTGFNMHFGYFRAGLNPFRREGMLNEMNRQVLERLGLCRRHVSAGTDCRGFFRNPAQRTVAPHRTQDPR